VKLAMPEVKTTFFAEEEVPLDESPEDGGGTSTGMGR